ncbi:sulfur carrier protein ThiS [Gallaecimonas kandeliae]|uniref:sulfur carrier protein ThiS n=1 Tax=Gallaecimonas kandeliae TaxID=3029055 RepID=UPI002649D419|nr:sulfur carrier protein ThiS [Gallaecimonas kandeliae]WKE65715.1 sulfur carrier protein ThiS [Gallaecimonas kandeliae]
MDIEINGKQRTLAAGTSLQAALDEIQARPPFAVAVNGRFVPRSQYDATPLKEGDSIEVLSPMEGG